LGNGQFQDAISVFRAAIAIRPNSAEVLCNLGYALKEAGQVGEAIAICRQSIQAKPDNPEAYTNLGSALQANDQIDEAIAAHRQAIVLRPGYAEAHNNLGSALSEAGQFEEALAEFSNAVELRPDLPEAHHDLAFALLSHGDFERGWEEYEWRWKCRGGSLPRPGFAQPRWDGAPFRNRTLLLYAEQGLGDAIQFIRYLPMVAERGGRIVLECQPPVQRLFQNFVQTIGGDCRIVCQGEALPQFDIQCPLLSLPLIFKTTLSTIPSRRPYLFPEPERIGQWQKRLEASGSDLKVGLAWAGSPGFKRDRYRSLSLDRLAPLADVLRVSFFSLQKGPAASEARHPPPGMKLVDWTDEFTHFNDDALIASLDLVISVDTSVAHLAGALGRPTWVLLCLAADWRWMLHRTDSPWYPSIRLFRQTSRGDWDGVIGRVVDALRLFIQER
jgi:cytochrome c-type biogenesis protein CcmH/NrfG